MGSPDVVVRRVDFGYFVRPGAETERGIDRVQPVLGYLVDHPDGALLLDTGMGSHPEVDDHYQPRRIGLAAALRSVGKSADDIAAVVNCHLHFDHCGNNPAFRARPIFVQAAELAAAREQNYTLPELVDAPGLVYEELAGDAEVLNGITVVPTPGHTAGHQSVVVHRRDGTVIVLAGQSHETASDYSADALAVQASDDGHARPIPMPPAWMKRLRDLDPRRVYFAHDHAVWTPD
ncbi:MAG: N-acyl homoserine lactone hydrolase [Kribbellaceae bacterium]|nr:N-acyl homoserine lactone hydrolase [Kribbellaceae bacterium]